MDYNQYNNGQMNNDYNNLYDRNSNQQRRIKEGSLIWGVLGFMFPILGLILYLVWKDSKPGDAKIAGKGALICVFVEMGISLIAVLFFGASWGQAQDSIVNNTCKTYGETYESVKKDGKWYCQDIVSGETIMLE